jgi:8-amino-7-oxononanoate synthase
MLKRVQHDNEDIFIVTESVFSMDGDSPDLASIIKVCQQYKAHLIVDEAHALGVFNFGMVQELGLDNDVFARIVTFGKALGCHGAAILGSRDLKDFLINFSRPFIYSTALPPHTIASIFLAYDELATTKQTEKLKNNITFFNTEIKRLNLQNLFITSNSAIHSCILPGNKRVKSMSKKLEANGLAVKPILSPTVSVGKERLRICLHSYNSKDEISNVLSLIATFANQ